MQQFFFALIESSGKVWMAKSYFSVHRYYIKVSLTIDG